MTFSHEMDQVDYNKKQTPKAHMGLVYYETSKTLVKFSL